MSVRQPRADHAPGSSPHMLVPSSDPSLILLVDDDDLVARSLRRYLLLQGYAAHVAPGAAIAAEIMRESQYRVIVVDPYLTGGVREHPGALLELIRKLQPHAAVIVLTAYDTDELMEVAARIGTTALLRKPQPVAIIAQVIVSALSNWPTRIPVHPHESVGPDTKRYL